MPGRAAQPTRAIPLDGLDHRARSRVVVTASSRNRTSTWLRTTSLRISIWGAAASSSPNRLAWAQHRSTSSATPVRPSERIAAYTGKLLARRENSGFQSNWSRGPSGSAWTRCLDQITDGLGVPDVRVRRQGDAIAGLVDVAAPAPQVSLKLALLPEVAARSTRPSTSRTVTCAATEYLPADAALNE